MSKPRIPYFDFYPTDFMNGVRGLTPNEVGIYIMILCRIYEENGPVEYHPARLSTYCGARENTFVKVFARLVDLGKFSMTDGMVMNNRAEREIASRETRLKINSRAGKISAEKRQQKQCMEPTNVQHAFNHTDTDKKDSVAKATGGDAADFAKIVFDRGVAFLCKHGHREQHARSLIGKWRKDHGDREIFDAFAAASKEGVTDPAAWIAARLKVAAPFSINFDLSKFEAKQ